MVNTAWALLWWVAAAASELTAQASSSARPKPCRADAALGVAPTAWDAVRRHATDQRCAQLARAQALLATAPDAALTLARELAPAWPDSPEPLVLEARALTRLELYREAWPVWQAARERGHDLAAPRALRDYAATAAAVGQHEAALTAYRRLMALRALWPDAQDRQALALEAAAAALRHDPPELDEAADALAAARSGATSTGLRALVAAFDALLAWRRGEPLAGTLPVDAGEVWSLVTRVRGSAWPRSYPMLPRHEAHAAASLLIERYSASEAAELWRPYVESLAGADGDLRGSAATRLRRLVASGGGR